MYFFLRMGTTPKWMGEKPLVVVGVFDHYHFNSYKDGPDTPRRFREFAVEPERVTVPTAEYIERWRERGTLLDALKERTQ